MQFSKLLVAAAAFASFAQAKVILTPTTFAGITVGTPFNISWADALGPVTLTLKNGPPNALKTVETIASGLQSDSAGSGSHMWTPESSLPADTYAIEITDGTTTNFGTQFELVGATASPSASTASSTSGTTATDSTATSASTSESMTTTATDSSSTSASTTGTKTTGSKTSTKTETGATTSATTDAPGNANGLASPLAMVLLAFAAVLSFN